MVVSFASANAQKSGDVVTEWLRLEGGNSQPGNTNSACRGFRGDEFSLNAGQRS